MIAAQESNNRLRRDCKAAIVADRKKVKLLIRQQKRSETPAGAGRLANDSLCSRNFPENIVYSFSLISHCLRIKSGNSPEVAVYALIDARVDD